MSQPHPSMPRMSFIPLILSCQLAICFAAADSNAQPADVYASYKININDELNVFRDGVVDAVYTISLCADVPNNKKPLQVAHHQETGHVFLILQKINGSDTISKVFGFYPKKGLPTLFFKSIKSVIKDNSHRDYDVGITKALTAEEFDTVLARSVFYARHIYHINKFNCYDYAIMIFNSVAGNDPLPIHRSKYPFIFGKGGSPCTVYRDLKKLKEAQGSWSANIQFGDLLAPVSTGRKSTKKFN